MDNREVLMETRYKIASIDDEVYKINVSIWNGHRDPIYGLTKYVLNWTKQEVIVEYAAALFNDISPPLWIKDDGRKMNVFPQKQTFSSLKKNLLLAYMVQLEKNQIDHPSNLRITCEWGDGSRNSPSGGFYNQTGHNVFYPIPHSYPKHNEYTYNCSMFNHVSELSFSQKVC